MFGIFASVEKKMRTNAANWLELAEKVHHYRRDLLSPAERAELVHHIEKLRTQLRNRDDASKLKLGIESLEGVLRKSGGRLYPKSSLVENVEFFLVAAIVILGIRTYFVQPFKIPTNSMWPSYYGMTPEVFKTPDDEPGLLRQGARFLTQLAIPKRIDAPADGEVQIFVRARSEKQGIARFDVVPGRKWLVFPTQLREYEIAVGRSRSLVKIRVPGDFDFDRALLDAYFNGAESYPVHQLRGSQGWLSTGKVVKKGERVLSFDILTGDQLFVDRMSYHFVRPKVGDGFVFRTGNITDLHPLMPGPKDQYYIKRLVGVPGDTLEIREPVLYRNGAPITGSEAFAKNAERADRYPGYRNEQPGGEYRRDHLKSPGDIFIVPADSYMALGDNSASSLDSRYWGTVPAKDVVGRPLFIYYPFTRRWGPAP